jgi:hypothetical protein
VFLPIPDVPAVTSATLPENVFAFMELAFRCLLFLKGIGSVYEETDVSEVVHRANDLWRSSWYAF